MGDATDELRATFKNGLTIVLKGDEKKFGKILAAIEKIVDTDD